MRWFVLNNLCLGKRTGLKLLLKAYYLVLHALKSILSLLSMASAVLVMKAMGRTSTKASMQYQHPKLEQVKQVLKPAQSANTRTADTLKFTAHSTAQ